MRVITLGTGDAFGAAGRFHSAVVVQAGNSRALVDCGPCILPALYRSRIPPEDIDFILVTHLHGDHVGGVPMLLLDYQYRSRRKRPLVVIGSALCRARIEALTGTDVRGGNEESPPLSRRLQDHPPRASDDHSRDAHSRVSDEAHRPGTVPWLSHRIPPQGSGHHGDTTWCDSIPAMSQGADLLVTECTDFNRRTPVHLSYTQLREHQAEIAAKRIVLTHVGDDLLKNRARVRHHIARDGERFDV